jgi:hypothetical protein
MLRRFVMGVLLIAAGSWATWMEWVAAYFGRVDPAHWAEEHPTPAAPDVEPGRHRVSIASTRRIVPSAGLSPELEVQTANNNLDVVRHEGRVYLAWRTAPSHFPGNQTVVNVASSDDEQTWRFEARFHAGTDLREPRLLSLHGRLFLYVSRLGSNPFIFEPHGVSTSERTPDGRWSALEPVGPEGAIAWRVKPFEGEAVMVAYRGGEHLYTFDGSALTVELWRTADGRHFRAFRGDESVVVRGGGSETDFVLDARGDLFALVRNEAGDASGWGSKLCHAPARDLLAWSCTTDPRKYDSPLVFEHDGEIYAVARRNLTESGDYDRRSGSGAVRTIRNELAYITTAKRCALWRWVKSEDRMAFVMDLPSRGDTCFPSKIDDPATNHVVVYDYSSDVDGPELPWSAGQRRDTYVYRHELVFERR